MYYIVGDTIIATFRDVHPTDTCLFTLATPGQSDFSTSDPPIAASCNFGLTPEATLPILPILGHGYRIVAHIIRASTRHTRVINMA